MSQVSLCVCFGDILIGLVARCPIVFCLIYLFSFQDEVMSLISMGLRVRATHETKMNAFSSRSHTVFTITVLQRDKITGQSITGGCTVHFVL